MKKYIKIPFVNEFDEITRGVFNYNNPNTIRVRYAAVVHRSLGPTIECCRRHLPVRE